MGKKTFFGNFLYSLDISDFIKFIATTEEVFLQKRMYQTLWVQEEQQWMSWPLFLWSNQMRQSWLQWPKFWSIYWARSEICLTKNFVIRGLRVFFLKWAPCNYWVTYELNSNYLETYDVPQNRLSEPQNTSKALIPPSLRRKAEDQSVSGKTKIKKKINLFIVILGS